jgi:hypothetical protein
MYIGSETLKNSSNEPDICLCDVLRPGKAKVVVSRIGVKT